MSNQLPLRIAVIGSGAAGLAAAWLLGRRHHVTLFEKDDRAGGHAHTAIVGEKGDLIAIDTGFIVYNDLTYPNLSAWLDHLGVATQASDMSFAVSRNNGNFEYKGGTFSDLLAQPSNLFRPRFYRMLLDLLRFYRTYHDAHGPDTSITLAQLLEQGNYSKTFLEDHLLPFAAAIWSSTPDRMLDYPARAFVQFCSNHGLLKLSHRPQWRTITGGSQAYVSQVLSEIGKRNFLSNAEVAQVRRTESGATLVFLDGRQRFYDHVVLATHADQALAVLDDADAMERRLLEPFKYELNSAVLHSDVSLMPKRRRAWASWNYIDNENAIKKSTVSYWMNNLQNLACSQDYIVSLNPAHSPRPDLVVRSSMYSHPQFNTATYSAQEKLWLLQGRRNTWYCGAYFGAGFHEDAIQSGLAVAEQLGGISRPWHVSDPSGRIHIHTAAESAALAESA